MLPCTVKWLAPDVGGAAGPRDWTHTHHMTAVRIGLNLLHALPEIGGGWNYIERLVAGLLAHAGDRELVVFVSPVSADMLPPGTGAHRELIELNARSRGARVWSEHTALLQRGRRVGVQVMHHFAGTMPLRSAWANAVSVYDLLVYRDPSVYPLLKLAYLRAVMPYALRRAEMLLPMSETTAADVAERFGAGPERMSVIPAIVDDSFRPPAPEAVARLRARHALPERFWLYVAHHYPHKNHATLLRAFAEQDGPRWPLVLRGDGTEALRATAAELGIADRVHFLPPLEGADMPTLYGAASGLVFPSLFEGGGIPVLEAMACGCPVVASDIPTTREFAAEAARRFPATDVEALRAALREVEESVPLRESQRRLGIARAERYRSAVVARSCLAAYDRAWQSFTGARGLAAAASDR
jgi:glycosyltransferase involved in cell wall biosynthesis